MTLEFHPFQFGVKNNEIYLIDSNRFRLPNKKEQNGYYSDV